ncbi:MAG: hypothetical protein F6K19_29880 [Cyanothece sp. SIO1E1]|nr:hypothetical protein [Cyanothece sp. SIO1E1]
MKLLAICDPTQYNRPALDIPVFYQRLAADPRVDFFHASVEAVQAQNWVAATPVQGNLSYEAFLDLNSAAQTWHPLKDFDLVFCRTLKPFPNGYLDHLCGWAQQTQFVNNPAGIQAQIHPTFLVQVAGEFIPETIVTDNALTAQLFFDRHSVIVAKQANSCGGRGVFKIWCTGNHFKVDNMVLGTQTFSHFAQVMNYLQGPAGKLLQFMRYLGQVDVGDKRVVVVDGEIYGAYLRRSKSGYWVNNVSFDGECHLADISDAEREAIARTWPFYRQLGLCTLGYDFLLDDDGTWRISEINAGNIGGFARLEELTNKPVFERFTTWLTDFAKQAQPVLIQV